MSETKEKNCNQINDENSEEKRMLMEKKTYTKWINSLVEKFSMKVEDLFVDLTDGCILLKLLEVLSGEIVGEPNLGQTRAQKMENIDRCFRFLSNRVNLGPIEKEHIIDGNSKMLLALLWIIISKFHIECIKVKFNEKINLEGKEALLNWCERKTRGYHCVSASNFTQSWSSGLTFNALIHAHRPDLFDYICKILSNPNDLENLNYAFEVASDELGIPKLLDAEDFIDPDEKSVMLYVAYYYHTFNPTENKPKITKQIHEKEIVNEKKTHVVESKENEINCQKTDNVRVENKISSNKNENNQNDKTKIAGEDLYETRIIKPLRNNILCVQKKTFTKWINSNLQKLSLKVEDIFDDFSDGHKLLKLLEIVSGEKIAKPTVGFTRVHKIENVNKSLSYLRSKVIHLESIGAEDVVDGNPQLILGLIWTIILNFRIYEIKKKDKNKFNRKISAKNALLMWCQKKTDNYQNVYINNFTSSWRSGLAFNALIHSYCPHFFDYNSLLLNSNIQNLNHAFDIADKQLGILKLLEAEDIDTDEPDEKSIITYVANYYHTFACMINNTQPGIKSNNTTFTQTNEEETKTAIPLPIVNFQNDEFKSPVESKTGFKEKITDATALKSVVGNKECDNPYVDPKIDIIKEQDLISFDVDSRIDKTKLDVNTPIPNENNDFVHKHSRNFDHTKEKILTYDIKNDTNFVENKNNTIFAPSNISHNFERTNPFVDSKTSSIIEQNIISFDVDLKPDKTKLKVGVPIANVKNDFVNAFKHSRNFNHAKDKIITCDVINDVENDINFKKNKSNAGFTPSNISYNSEDCKYSYVDSKINSIMEQDLISFDVDLKPDNTKLNDDIPFPNIEENISEYGSSFHNTKEKFIKNNNNDIENEIDSDGSITRTLKDEINFNEDNEKPLVKNKVSEAKTIKYIEKQYVTINKPRDTVTQNISNSQDLILNLLCIIVSIYFGFLLFQILHTPS